MTIVKISHILDKVKTLIHTVNSKIMILYMLKQIKFDRMDRVSNVIENMPFFNDSDIFLW